MGATALIDAEDFGLERLSMMTYLSNVQRLLGEM
jgi:hypothetical protein